MFFWTKNRRRELSAYIDGELPAAQQMRIGEQLAFDGDLRSQLAELEQAQALANAALAPPTADPASFVATLPTAIPPEVPPTKTRRHLAPAAIAAAGILVTAGITLARLRRRGIV